METTINEPVKETTESDPIEPTVNPDDLRAEQIDELLLRKRKRRIENNQAPCPGCTIGISIDVNRCPHCDSDIAAENALAREIVRVLSEHGHNLDGEHSVRPDEDGDGDKLSFGARLKRFFGSTKEEPVIVDPPMVDPHARRIMGNVSPGDSLKVLEEDGPWIKVKTIAGDTGWLYSTVRKDS